MNKDFFVTVYSIILFIVQSFFYCLEIMKYCIIHFIFLEADFFILDKVTHIVNYIVFMYDCTSSRGRDKAVNREDKRSRR
jgi:hypothetical protein